MITPRTHFSTALTLLLALGVPLLLFVPHAVAKKGKTKYLERYSARALSMGNVATGKTSTVEIAISRWTTPEERAGLLEILVEKGQEAFIEALQAQPEAGFVRFANSLGHRLRYAWQRTDGEQRQIILATDRPIASGEISRSARTLDYAVSLTQLKVDPEGNGEGLLALAVELSVNEQQRALELKHYDVEPLRLTSVRRRK